MLQEKEGEEGIKARLKAWNARGSKLPQKQFARVAAVTRRMLRQPPTAHVELAEMQGSLRDGIGPGVSGSALQLDLSSSPQVSGDALSRIL